MTYKVSCLLLVLTVAFSSVFSQEISPKFVSSNDKHLSYIGRVGFTDSCAQFYWTGTSVTINVFNTKSVKALLSDDKDGDYYYVIVDGNGKDAIKIKIGKQKKLYNLATDLTTSKHAIQLFKVTNTDFITAHFYGFELDAEAKVLKADNLPKRKIEFFGNSITCGHGAENNSNGSGAPEFFNNYRAYGAIAARHFNAQYHCTAKSGIGITVSWFPEVMPDIYDRLNPADPNSKWDFKKYTPDIVVINLFQNDSWIVNMPENAQFKARFGTTKPTEEFIIEAYKNFLQSVRNKYPKAHIICSLGDMDATQENSKWPGYINTAVADMNDKKMVTHFFPYKGTSGHPIIKDHETIANDLIAFIEKEGYWK